MMVTIRSAKAKTSIDVRVPLFFLNNGGCMAHRDHVT